MRIFLTGATGYIGGAVLDAALRAGHQVTALVRDPENAERASKRGIQPVIGELSKPASYAPAAEVCDGIVHTALDSSARRPQVDRQAIDTLMDAARRRAPSGQPRFFVYTSGVWVLGSTTTPATEDAPLAPTPFSAWRPQHERVVLDAGADGRLRTAVVRPGIVYRGARGLIRRPVKQPSHGLVRVLGNGRNHWPCI